MRNAVYILFLSLLLSISICANSGIKVASVSTPEYVLKGDGLILSAKVIRDLNQNSIDLYLHTSLEVSLKSVELRGPTLTKPMRYYRVNDENGMLDKVYKIESGDISGSNDEICQVNFSLTVSGEKSPQFFLSTDEEFVDENEHERLSRQIKIYNESSSAGKCLNLLPETEINFPISQEEQESNSYLVEFWARLNSDQSDVFSINNSFGEELFTLSVSDFGYLVTNHLLDAEVFNEYFISKKSWNYFFIKFDTETSKIIIYINDTLFYNGVVSELLNQENVNVVLKNNSNELNTLVDRIKIWSFNNKPILALLNKNFNSYSADSSSVIYQNNFDSDNSINDISHSGNLVLTKSSAPIFSQAPVLNVMLYGQSYQLYWEVSDLSQAKSFVIEKSYDGKNYEYVSSVRVLDQAQNNYSVTDFDNTDNQIIYYRVKQINSDDSIIYSSDAKVGRGKIKHFVLEQNYPNPFNPITTVSVEVTRADQFEVIVYDIVGKTVAILHNGPLGEGLHRFSFDGSNIPSGLYLCEIKSGDEIEVMKMILTK